MAKRRRSSSTDLALLEVEDAPRSGLLDAKRLARRSTFFRAYVWIAVVMLPIVSIGFIGSLGGGAGSSELSAGSRATSSPGRAVAVGVLNSWLASDPAPLPGAQVISWDGATVIATRTIEPAAKSVENYDVVTESNEFTLGVPVPDVTTTTVAETVDPSTGLPTGLPTASTSEPETTTTTTEADNQGDPSSIRPEDLPTPWAQTYKATVLVEVDSRGGTKPVARPSIVPIPPPATDGWEESAPVWTGLDRLSTPAPVKTAISRWSVAYISADPEELRLATGDPIATNRYSPLAGPESITATVVASATVDDGVTAVARVRLQPRWPGQPVAEEGKSRDVPVAPPFELDVLVINAATGSPVVVAWGPPGTGADLKPYENAVIGERSTGRTTTTTSTTESSTTIPADSTTTLVDSASSTAPPAAPVTAPPATDPAAPPAGQVPTAPQPGGA